MNIALLLSGGAGTRIGGDIPKQYRKAGGRLVISYCMETLLAHPDIDALQIVAEPKWQQELIQCGERLCGFLCRGLTGRCLFFMGWRLFGRMGGMGTMC